MNYEHKSKENKSDASDISEDELGLNDNANINKDEDFRVELEQSLDQNGDGEIVKEIVNKQHVDVEKEKDAASIYSSQELSSVSIKEGVDQSQSVPEEESNKATAPKSNDNTVISKPSDTKSRPYVCEICGRGFKEVRNAAIKT